MNLNWKREFFPWFVLIAMAGVAIHYYPILPDTIASHFDIHGMPNGWMKKDIFYLLMVGAGVFIYLLFTFLPLIDPLKRKIQTRFRNILLLRDAFITFLTVIFSLSLEAAHEGTLNIDLFGILVGLLFVVIGNYMPKIPQNWFIGIRTPWTISSEMVWKKTHILGGWLFVSSGVLYLVCAALKINSLIPLSAILISAVVSILYSFVLYKKIQKSGDVH